MYACEPTATARTERAKGLARFGGRFEKGVILRRTNDVRFRFRYKRPARPIAFFRQSSTSITDRKDRCLFNRYPGIVLLLVDETPSQGSSQWFCRTCRFYTAAWWQDGGNRHETKMGRFAVVHGRFCARAIYKHNRDRNKRSRINGAEVKSEFNELTGKLIGLDYKTHLDKLLRLTFWPVDNRLRFARPNHAILGCRPYIHRTCLFCLTFGGVCRSYGIVVHCVLATLKIVVQSRT